MIEAIILAAGESRRMGQLKPLIKINGLTFLQRITNEIRSSGITTISIVVGFQAEKIKNESGAIGQFVINENYPNGQFSSLQCGIKSLSENCSGVVVCLGDQPQVKSDWIKSLVHSFNASPAAIIRPSFHGKSGHPLLYSAQVFDDILAMPPTATAKELMSKYKDESHFVEINSDGILYDADWPEDVERIKNHYI